METKYKITIPEPCKEDWNAMKPEENGRFCSSCAKTVIDFSVMLPDEIHAFFIQNKDQKLCGRFKKTQLDNLVIQIPSYVLNTQTQYHKMFLLALFIAMGSTLFCCSDKKGHKQKIDKVEVVENFIEKEQPNSDTIPKSSSKNSVKTVVSHQKKNIKPNNKQLNLEKNPVEYSEPIAKIIYEEDDAIYGVAGISVKPDYPGGIKIFFDLFANEFKFPKKERKSTGEIQVSFIIEKDGTLTNIKPIKEIGFGTTEETVRVLNLSKKWSPAALNGKAATVPYLLSIPVVKDSLNPKRRKRKFSKIGNLKLREL